MDIGMFIEFPGILITIGAALLLLSIIIVIFAYKTADKEMPSSLGSERYQATVRNEGYDDNGNPKIVLEANNVPGEPAFNYDLGANNISKKEESDLNSDLEATKVFKWDQNLSPAEEEKIQEFIKVKPSVVNEVQEDEDIQDVKIDAFAEEFKDFEKTEEKPKQEVKQEEEEEIELL